MLVESSITTTRLILTPLTVEDAGEMATVLGDPALYQFTGGQPESAELLAVRYSRWVAGASKPGQTWLNLIVREQFSLGAIGYVQATINSQVTDIAWVIGTRWQRNGYATEATRAMVDHLARVFQVRRLRALIRPGHIASQVIATRLGMTVSSEVVDGEQVWLGIVGRSI